MDATSLLGSMIGSHFGRGRGPGLGTVALGTAGVAAAGGLGYLAYRHFQSQPGSAQAAPPPAAGAPAGGGGFFSGVVGSSSGMRSGDFSVPGYEWQQGGGTMPAAPAPAAPPPAFTAQPTPAPSVEQQGHALLLVRAMVAAAHADGALDESERADIVSRLDAAGVGQSEREAFLRELETPKPITLLTSQVTSPDLAEQFYVLSVVSINADTEAEKAHLRMLPALLKLSPDAVQAIHQKTGLPPIS